jgi:hypothetical protein
VTPWIREFLIPITTLVFALGITYGAFKAAMKDLRGVANKVREMESAGEREYWTMVLMLLAREVPEKDRFYFLAQCRLFLETRRRR